LLSRICVAFVACVVVIVALIGASSNYQSRETTLLGQRADAAIAR
jgi:hypothetical protein